MKSLISKKWKTRFVLWFGLYAIIAFVSWHFSFMDWNWFARFIFAFFCLAILVNTND